MTKKSQPGRLLAKQSFNLVKTHKKLLIFPVSSAILSILLFALIATPLWQFEKAFFSAKQQNLHAAIPIIILLVFFFFSNFLIVFFNSALTACCSAFLKGEKPSIKLGLTVATKNLPNIFVWTCISTTIGITIKIIEAWTEKWNSMSIVMSWLAGATWSIATYFVIPLYYQENVYGFSNRVEGKARVDERVFAFDLKKR